MKTDVLIIGGGPAGINTATAIKSNYPDKEVLIVRREKVELFPPKIPYVFATLKSIDEAVMNTNPAEKLGIKFIYDEVTNIDFKDKKVDLKSGEDVEYEKLVLATGSLPIIPRMEGVNKEGVFSISKDREYLQEVLEHARKVQRILIVGGGFIGVEVCDELRKLKKKVIVVEAMPYLLSAAFDEEFGKIVEEHLSEHGVNVKTNAMVERILGDGKVSAVQLKDGSLIETDMVILSIGYRPNVDLVKNTEINLGFSGAIWVDEYMRTNVKDVFAVGDCAEHRDFFTGKYRRIMLVSTAISDAKIIGENIYGLKPFEKSYGSLSTFSMSIEGLTLGAVGMTLKTALNEGFECVTGRAQTIDEGMDKKSEKEVYVKMVFSKEDGVLLGAQILSNENIGRILNIVQTAVKNKVTAKDLPDMKVGKKVLNSIPEADILIVASELARFKIK